MNEVRAEITTDQYGWAGLHLLYFSRAVLHRVSIEYFLLLYISGFLFLHISMVLPGPSYTAAVHSSSPPAPTFTNRYYCCDSYSSSSSLPLSLSRLPLLSLFLSGHAYLSPLHSSVRPFVRLPVLPAHSDVS